MTSNVVTYEVVIDAPNPDLKLKPGLTANITVLIHEKEDVLMMPLRALRFQPEDADGEPMVSEALKSQPGMKGGKSVWVQTPEGLICKNVRTGISDGYRDSGACKSFRSQKKCTGRQSPDA